jgi:hypothetical protein
MAYTLQAIIGDIAVLQAESPANATVVVLPQGKAMIPLTQRLFAKNEFPSLPLTDEGCAAVLPRSIDGFVAPFIGRGKFAYVEAEFFGGVGTQAIVTWDDKGNASLPLVDAHAINKALRFLGVQIGDHHDEFNALGLGKHRSTGEWESELKAQNC